MDESVIMKNQQIDICAKCTRNNIKIEEKIQNIQ